MDAAAEHFDYVVIGGGVAGTCCANQLCRSRPDASICLISPSEHLKSVKVVKKVSEHLEELTVIEEPFEGIFIEAKNNLRFVKDFVDCVKPDEKLVGLGNSGGWISYGKLAICTGASPKTHRGSSSGNSATPRRVLTVRDTDSADELNKALSEAKKVVIAGNGPIAMELITKLRGLDVAWIVKQDHIGDALFLGEDVGSFLLECLEKRSGVNIEQQQSSTPTTTKAEEASPREVPPSAKPRFSHGLGPRWTIRLSQKNENESSTDLTVVYNTELVDAVEKQKSDGGDSADESDDWPVHAVLSNGETIGADLVVSCVGVLPNTAWLPEEFARDDDGDGGGLLVDETMRTSVRDVYAAGDACTLTNCGPQFFQVRLWSQARLTGEFAAHCMVDPKKAEYLDLGFELFTHITHFFGKKVILLGLYDGQRLEDEHGEDIATHTRVVPGESFVRVTLLRGRLQGAVLVGETDLEEAFENLILDGIDLSSYGPAILDPDAELEDYFD